jgi:hypothetical protein
VSTGTPNADRAPLRPRHALCAHCGYHFNAAVPVIDNTLRCPECGRVTPLSFEAMAGRRRTRHWLAWTIGLTLGVAALVGVSALLVSLLGYRRASAPARLAVMVAFLAGTWGLAWLVVVLRRRLVTRHSRPAR